MNSDIRVETKQSSQEYEKTLDELWNYIRSVPNSQKQAIINNLDESTINALRTRKNPYKKPIIAGNKVRILAFNIINFTEKYAQRFAMTSLIAFLYRMLDEYNIDSEYISENDPQFTNIYNKKVKELLLKKPEDFLMKELDTIKSELSKQGKQDAKLTKKSFIIRAKIIKYRLHLLKNDKNNITEKSEEADRTIRKFNNRLKITGETIAIAKSKLEQRIKYENERKRKTFQETCDSKDSKDSVSESNDSDSDNESNQSRDPKQILTIKDVKKRSISSYEQEIKNNDELYLNTVKELSDKTAEFESYQKNISDLNLMITNFNNAFTDLKNEYFKVFSSKKNKDERNKEFDAIEIDKYDPTEDELNAIADETKKELGIEITAEEYSEKIQNIIQPFLDKYLRYNPDNHVRCAYKPNYEDKTRTPLKKNEVYERNILPPDDTFFRLNRYIENHYEELRQATDDIYCEKSDFDADIVPLEVFEGDSVDEVNAKFDEYKRKYADEFEADVFSATFARHNLLSPFYENRKVRDFYTKQTEIIKRMLDQNKDDVSMGKKLMGDRAKKGRKEKEPDGLKMYRNAMGSSLEEHGAVHIDEILENEIPRDTNDLNDEEIEVGVHVIKPKGSGRRMRGYTEQFKFHVDSENLKKNQTNVNNPNEFKEKLLKQETSV